MINNVLRNAIKVAVPVAIATVLGFSQVSFAEDDFEASFEEGLEDVSEGYGRFRYGFLFSLGLEGGSCSGPVKV